jgi:hypothetical protein
MNWTTLTALSALYGCQSDSVPSQATATPAGTGIPLVAVNQPPFCIGQISSQYGIQPEYVTTSVPVTASDGTISIDGTTDQETDGRTSFRCRFDAQGRFIDAVTMTTDGRL